MRWSARHKIAVVRALAAGALSGAEARERYLLSAEELASWQSAYGRHGLGGLLVKSLRYRRYAERDAPHAAT